MGISKILSGGFLGLTMAFLTFLLLPSGTATVIGDLNPAFGFLLAAMRLTEWWASTSAALAILTGGIATGLVMRKKLTGALSGLLSGVFIIFLSLLPIGLELVGIRLPLQLGPRVLVLTQLTIIRWAGCCIIPTIGGLLGGAASSI